MRGAEKLDLTPREKQVVRLILAGRETGAIASELGCAEDTARTHVQNILHKTKKASKLALAASLWERERQSLKARIAELETITGCNGRHFSAEEEGKLRALAVAVAKMLPRPGEVSC